LAIANQRVLVETLQVNDAIAAIMVLEEVATVKVGVVAIIQDLVHELHETGVLFPVSLEGGVRRIRGHGLVMANDPGDDGLLSLTQLGKALHLIGVLVCTPGTLCLRRVFLQSLEPKDWNHHWVGSLNQMVHQVTDELEVRPLTERCFFPNNVLTD
jgi:hypothetical protein